MKPELIRNSVVERPLVVPWVMLSVPHGGLIELFPIPTRAPTNGASKTVNWRHRVSPFPQWYYPTSEAIQS